MPSIATTKSLIRSSVIQLLTGLTLGSGNVFYVDSGHTNAKDYADHGKDPTQPYATIDYAIGRCTATNGDVIFVARGHTDTISAADGINADVAGVSIIGCGIGSDKPTITLGSATTATFGINAANVTVKGLRFVGDIDSLATFIDVDEGYARIEDCDFVTSNTKEAICFIDLATTKDYFWIIGCRFEQPTDPGGTDGGAGTGAIYCVDSEYIFVENCHFAGNFETAFIHNKTTACKHLWVKNCTGIAALSGSEPFQLVAGATGATVGGGFITPAETGVTDATLIGTIGDAFFNLGTYFGNDGGGGQAGVLGTAAS